MELQVIEGKRSACPENFFKVKAGFGLDGDFNQGSFGRYIWLCVRESNDGEATDAITNLTVVGAGRSVEGCGDLEGDWHRVEQAQGSNGDFNHGAFGKRIYLCYMKDPDAAPITNLETSQGDCIVDMYRIAHNNQSDGDFNEGSFGKHIYLCFQRGCRATSVVGRWVPHNGQIFTTGSEVWSKGMRYQHSESKTVGWKESVTYKASEGWTYEGDSGSVEVSTTIAQETSTTYSSAWSTTSTHSYQVDYTSDMIGRQAWQFQFVVTDSCTHVETGYVAAMAVTTGAFQPPCCVPGYAVDAPTYKVCHSTDSMIFNGTQHGCSVAGVLV